MVEIMKLKNLNTGLVLATVCTVILSASYVGAVNEFRVDETKQLFAGESGEIELVLENDETILGYSFGVTVDSGAFTVTGVTEVGTAAAGAEFFDGNIIDGVVGWGVIMDTDTNMDKMISVDGIAAGAHVMAILQVDVAPGSAGASPVTYQAAAVYPAPSPPVTNVMTDLMGFSISPGLANGSITIVEPALPVISSIDPSSGASGAQIMIAGENFYADGLTASVCGTAVTPTGSETSIVATVPDCGLDDPATVVVEVCNFVGCTTSKAFTYEPPPEGTLFRRGDANSDGAVNIADGVTVLNFLFTGGERPSCLASADTDDVGGINLTDGVYVLGFLFLGGPIPPPPGPFTCDLDGTPEDTSECLAYPASCQ